MSGPRDKARARRALYTTVISAVPPALDLLAVAMNAFFQ